MQIKRAHLQAALSAWALCRSDKWRVRAPEDVELIEVQLLTGAFFHHLANEAVFVELEDLFIEGLVPLNSLDDDHYTFRENTRQIIGDRTKKTYSIGDKVRVIVDRLDRMQRKIQFAVQAEKPSRAQKRHRKRG